MQILIVQLIGAARDKFCLALSWTALIKNIIYITSIMFITGRTWPLLFLDTAESLESWGVRPYVELWKRQFPLDTNLYREHSMADMERQIHLLAKVDNGTRPACP